MVFHVVPMACGATRASFARITTRRTRRLNLTPRVTRCPRRAIVAAPHRAAYGTRLTVGHGARSANISNIRLYAASVAAWGRVFASINYTKGKL